MVLLDQPAIGTNELCRKLSFGDGTIKKYLNEMISDEIVLKEGSVKGGKDRLRLVFPGSIEVIPILQYWLDSDIKPLDNLIDTVKSVIGSHNKGEMNALENEEIRSHLLNDLVKQTMEWFHIYRMHLLSLVSGSVTKMGRNMIKKFGESGLIKIEILFDMLKRSDPKMHSEFSRRVGLEMIRQQNSIKFSLWDYIKFGKENGNNLKSPVSDDSVSSQHSF